MRIGEHSFDLKERILRDAAGTQVALRSQSAKVLAELAAHVNRIVDRDELIQTVWNGRAIADDGVAQCIRDIRRALGDFRHRTVVTCHKRGYRLNVAEAEKRETARRPKVCIEPISTSGQSDQALERDLAMALHEQLLVNLAPRTGIRVVAGDYPPKDADYSVGGRLSLQEGRSGLFIRLTTPHDGQLVHVERFELKLSSGFADVIETAQQICHVLLVHIIANHGQRYAETPNAQLAVQPLLMKAAHLYGYLSVDGTRQAVDCLDAALAQDPDNAMALAMRANAATQMIPHIMEEKPEREVRGALELADRAVTLGPTIDFVYRTRANLRLWLLGDHDGSRADCRRALELNPMLHLTHLTLGTSQILSGQYQDGLDRIVEFSNHLRSERQYPYYLSLIALAHLMMENEDEAIDFATDAYERMPASDWHKLVYLAATRGAAGEPGYPREQFTFGGSSSPSFEKLPFTNLADARRLTARVSWHLKK